MVLEANDSLADFGCLQTDETINGQSWITIRPIRVMT